MAPDTFAEVARRLAVRDNVESTLQRIIELAVEIVPHAEHAAVSQVLARKHVTTVAACDETPRASTPSSARPGRSLPGPQAQGILMAKYKITADQAFALLRSNHRTGT